MSDQLITFEENGFPIELISDRDIAKAAKTGRLRADTIVTIYDDQGSITRHRADEVPRLSSFFGSEKADIAETEIPATLPDAEVSVPAGAQPEVAEESPTEEPSESWLGDSPAATKAPNQYPPVGMSAGSSASAAPILISVGLLVALVVLAIVLGQSPAPPAGDLGNDYIDTNMTDLGTPELEVSPEEVIGEAGTYYATRETIARARSTTAADEVARLARGESIFGTPVRARSSGEEWLRLDNGPYSGSFVWLRNLSTIPRPELLAALDGARTVQVETAVYAQPDSASAVLQSLPAGTEVSLIGEVAGGWWEISLRSGGVGYVGSAAFASPTATEGRGIVLSNSCRESIDVRLVYLESFGWSDAGGSYWRVAPGESFRITHNGQLVQTTSDEIYYHITSRAGPWTSSNTRYFTHGGRQLLMNRANYSIDANGNYFISFTCN